MVRRPLRDRSPSGSGARDKETASLSPAQEPHADPPPRHVTVAGGTLPVREWGAGRPVLLLHGISANHTEWRDVGRALATDFRVLIPDLLGRGDSRPEPDAAFSLGEETSRIEELLAVLGVERPVVAGHSHGASLALSLACRRPLAGLLLASPVTPWTPKPPPLRLLESRTLRRAVEPVLRTCRRPLTRYILTRRVYGERAPRMDDAVDRYAAPYGDRDRARALLRVFRDWDPAALRSLEPPRELAIRVVTGGMDRRIRSSDVVRWARRLGASCTIVDRAGHGLTEEEPEHMAAILRDIMARAET